MVKKISYMGEENASLWMRKIDGHLLGLYRILPFTYLGLFRSAFGDLLSSRGKITMLDLGCGDGSATQSLNLPDNFEITGVDIFKPYLDLAKDKGIYKKLIRTDVRSFNPRGKFDILVAAHILEHFDKSEGRKFLKKAESLAKKKVIIIIPIGEHPQETYDDNRHQEHKSSWQVIEMRDLGYSVRAHGLRALWGSENVVFKYRLFSYILFLISDLLFPLLFLKPEWGTYMICVKNKN